MEVVLVSPGALWLLAAVAAVAVTLFVFRARDRRSRSRVDRRASASGGVLEVTLLLLALSLLVVALARPIARGEAGVSAVSPVDVVVAIDVSTSMLAEDVSPSRLERARAVLLDLLSRLEGQRVALVAFSGASGVLLPLTSDLGAARMYVEQLQAQSVDEPGTSLERAVVRAVELFESGGQGERVLVVVSDGEDLGGDALGAASSAGAAAAEAGISVAAVVVGTVEGGTIALDVMGTETIKRGPGGEPVVTRARPDALASLAGGGLVVDAASADAAATVAEFVVARAAPGASATSGDRELFQVPLIAALALLAVEYVLASRRR